MLRGNRIEMTGLLFIAVIFVVIDGFGMSGWVRVRVRVTIGLG